MSKLNTDLYGSKKSVTISVAEHPFYQRANHQNRTRMTPMSRLNTDSDGLKNSVKISVAEHPFYQRANHQDGTRMTPMSKLNTDLYGSKKSVAISIAEHSFYTSTSSAQRSACQSRTELELNSNGVILYKIIYRYVYFIMRK